jgi:putative acetyltransferase
MLTACMSTQTSSGAARALLQYVEQQARAIYVRRLYTEASITARPAFEAVGFRVIVPQTITMRGVA